MRPLRQQRGAAILTAMLTVALVAALAAAALWQQWRGVEIESAERERLQSAWILQGALDWARLILREDARSNASADHLAEPWAVPLQEARLSTFLAAGQQSATSGGLEESFLSGRIVDLQGRLNLLGLVREGVPHPPTLRAFGRLFDTLRLPRGELLQLVAALQAAQTPGSDRRAPLLPQRSAELAWLGLSPPSIATLTPFISLLPAPTPVNLNTAPVEVLHACLPGASMADAQRLLAARAIAHFRDLNDVTRALAQAGIPIDPAQHAVASNFFEVSGQVRLGSRVVQERSLVQRNSERQVSVRWRERSAQTLAAPPGSVQ